MTPVQQATTLFRAMVAEVDRLLAGIDQDKLNSAPGRVVVAKMLAELEPCADAASMASASLQEAVSRLRGIAGEFRA